MIKISIFIFVFFLCSGCQKELENPLLPVEKQELIERTEPPVEISSTKEIPAETIEKIDKQQEEEKSLQEYAIFLAQKKQETTEIATHLQKIRDEQESENQKKSESLFLEELEKSIKTLEKSILALEKDKKQLENIFQELQRIPTISSPALQEQFKNIEYQNGNLRKKIEELDKKYQGLKENGIKILTERKKIYEERLVIKNPLKILCPPSLECLMEEWKTIWQKLYANSHLEVQYSNSYDIPGILEKEKPSVVFSWLALEETDGYHSTIIAYDALAIILFSKNLTDTISLDSLASIYTGTQKNWQQVNLSATSIPIKVYGWEANTIPFFWFSKILPEGKIFVAGIQVYSQEKEILHEISKSEEAIGYIPSSYLENYQNKHNIKIAKISGYTTKSEKYPLRYPLHCFYKQETQEEKKFQEFLNSSLAKKALQSKGFLEQ